MGWTEKKSNAEVVGMIDEPRQIIEIRNTEFYGHVVRYNTFIINITEGKINGKIGGRRPKETYFWGIRRSCFLYRVMKKRKD